MPKYLIRGNYTPEGLAGLIKDGGTGRRAAVEQAAKSLGGNLEAMYFALGDTDVYVIVNLPDAVSATAVALAAGSSRSVTLNTCELLTPGDVDAAIKKTVKYRAPGAKK